VDVLLAIFLSRKTAYFLGKTLASGFVLYELGASFPQKPAILA
jgi:hypothetical protein